jgi:hypothetical protein
MKGVDSRSVLGLLFSSEENSEVGEESCIVAYKLCTFQFSVYKIPNPGTYLQYKEFLMQMAKAWSTDQMAAADLESDTDLVRPGPSTATTCRPHMDPPVQLLGDMWKHTLVRIVKSEHSMKKYAGRQCRVRAVHKKRSGTAYMCNFCVVPLHKGECFQRYQNL